MVRKDRDEQSTSNPDKINVSEEGVLQVATHTRISVSQISLLMEKCGLSTLLVRVSCRLKYGDKETKMISVQRSVSQTFLFVHSFWLRKITTDPHILTHLNIECADDR